MCVSYQAINAFVLRALALVAAHGGSILNVAFPLLATSLGGVFLKTPARPAFGGAF
jgi:hypothetical protein